MFTCPLHQWASHELPCPACQKSQSFTTSDVVVNPAVPPDVEGQEELWVKIINKVLDYSISLDDTVSELMQTYHLTKKK